MSEFRSIVEQMRAQGAKRILFKRLADNDNSKNQVYLGSDFDVIKVIPSGDIYSDEKDKTKPIFKAPVDFRWINDTGATEKAPEAKLILYPNYPEVRFSGFLQGCRRDADVVPRDLMRKPEPDERKGDNGPWRYLILGVNEETVWGHCTDWSSALHDEVESIIAGDESEVIATVLYEYQPSKQTSEEKLLIRLKEIYQRGPIESCRLDSAGNLLTYKALNGAGYTLEAQFGITPNGSSDPDFMDWELKSHSGGVVTLMTPEPNVGTYLADLEQFLRSYGTNIQKERMDFSSRHCVDQYNAKSKLTMRLEGYDPISSKVTDPEGGLMLRDNKGNLAAGWKFEKLIEHWKKKHRNTCFVSSSKIKDGVVPKYLFGPNVTLGKGINLTRFLTALHSSTIYHDPGTNMKLVNNKWKPKKRNQFRVAWRNIDSLYNVVETVTLTS